MDLSVEKINIVKMILEIENPKILESINNILKSKSSDFWDDLSDYEKREIDLGITEVNEGKYFEYKSFIEKHLK